MRRIWPIHRVRIGYQDRRFLEVYNTLGYGFLEHIYTMALEAGLLLHFGPQPAFYRFI